MSITRRLRRTRRGISRRLALERMGTLLFAAGLLCASGAAVRSAPLHDGVYREKTGGKESLWTIAGWCWWTARNRFAPYTPPIPEPTHDGPAELPRAAAVNPLVTFDVEEFFADYTPRVNHMPATPAELRTLLTGGTLSGQTLQRGDWITLQAGTVYTSTSYRTQTLPALAGEFVWDDPSTWVLVRTTNQHNLRSCGTRVASTDEEAESAMADMARFDVFQNTGGVYPLYIANGAKGYCLDGIGGRREEGNWTAGNSYWISYGDEATQRTFASLPDALIISRSIFLGDCRNWETPAPLRPKGIYLNGRSFILRDSWIDAGAARGNPGAETGGLENQAVSSRHWLGPGLIDNNTIIASGENIMPGGEDPRSGELQTVGCNPCDVIVRRNYLPSRPQWNINDAQSDGYGVINKTNLEMKKGVRWLIECNDLSYWFLPDQDHAVNIKRVNQDGNDMNSQTLDVTFRFNILLEVAGFINFSNEGIANTSLDRISVHNNLAPMRYIARLGALVNNKKPFTFNAASFKIVNNTVCYVEIGAGLTPGNMMEFNRSANGYGDGEWTSNIGSATGIPWRTNDSVDGSVNTWSGTRTRFASIVDGGNVLIGGGTGWDPAASAKPATPNDLFVDIDSGDWDIKPEYRTAGLNGTVPGADLALLYERTEGCRTGVWT